MVGADGGRVLRYFVIGPTFFGLSLAMNFMTLNTSSATLSPSSSKLKTTTSASFTRRLQAFASSGGQEVRTLGGMGSADIPVMAWEEERR